MMKFLHGPFRLLAGDHTQDEPAMAEVRVKAREGDLIRCEHGGKEMLLAVNRGSGVTWEGQVFSCWLPVTVAGRTEGWRKVASPDLKVGDVLCLCQPRRYTRESEPFMSLHDLAARFNKGPASTKFVRVETGETELAAMRKRLLDQDARIAELEGQLGAKCGAQKPAAQSDDLAKMSLKELQDLAASEEIDLRGAKSKDEALKILRSALQPA